MAVRVSSSHSHTSDHFSSSCHHFHINDLATLSLLVIHGSPGGGEALVDHLEEVGVLEGGGHPLLVRELLVDGGLRLVGAGGDDDVDLKY